MADKNGNPERNQSMKNMKEALLKLNSHLEAFEQSVGKSSDKVARSGFAVGTHSAITKNDLIKKALELRNLSGLLENAGKKLDAIADQLGNESGQEELLVEVLNYCQFFGDQIISEKADVEKMLHLIRIQKQMQEQNKSKK